jgi:nucleoid DNA-binding protein
VNKKDLARRLAKESHRSRAQAADEVDTLIHRLLMDLKKPADKTKTPSSKANVLAHTKERS